MACQVTTGHRLTGLIALWVLIVVAAVGCGKKGPPRPPAPRSPRAPESVGARQIGTELRVWFTVPQARGGRSSQVLARAELFRVDYSPGFSPPPDPDVFRRRGEMVGAIETASLPASGERISIGDADLAALENGGTNSTLRYAIRTYDVRGRPSPLVAAADLVPLEVLPPPESLTGEATGDGIRIVWDPPPVPFEPPLPGEGEAETITPATPVEPEPAADGEDVEGVDADPAAEVDPESDSEVPRFKYNVYRGAPGEPAPERPIHPVPLTDTEFLDTETDEGGRYRYVVRVLLADGIPMRESASSLPMVLLARDLIAPQSPTGLVAVQEGESVRLFWHPNDERDVAGYRVYRRAGRGPWQQIGPEYVEQMTFIDRDVRVGQTVAYRVTAIDRAAPPNESETSELTELDIVSEPTAEGNDP